MERRKMPYKCANPITPVCNTILQTLPKDNRFLCGGCGKRIFVKIRDPIKRRVKVR